jgi:hypothetical protein
MHYFSEPDSDDESMATRDVICVDSGDENITYDPPTLTLPLPVPLLAPAPASPDLAVEVAEFVSSLALQPAPETTRYDHDWQTLRSAPFRILDRGPRLTSILFADGRSRILDTAAVDVFVRMTSHTPAPPPGPPPPRIPRSLLPPHISSASAQQSSSAPAPAPLAQWRQAQAEEDARPIVPTPWKQFTWGTTEDNNQEPEPWGRASRASSDSSSDSSPHSYAHTRSAHRPPASQASPPRSSFRGGTTVIATVSARDPSNPDPVAIVPILVGLDSYSDIAVAAPDLVYNKRKITESVGTGAGASDYFEEGFIDIADGLYSFRTLPALVASSPHHLPSSCSLLLGVPQLNELDIRIDVHRKQRNVPLSSYDPAIILAADSPLECRLSEKDLETWARHNASKPVGSIPYSYLDIDVNPALSAEQQERIRTIKSVFSAFSTLHKAPCPPR